MIAVVDTVFGWVTVNSRFETGRPRSKNVCERWAMQVDAEALGHVFSASVVKGSGDAAFDQAVLAMEQKSDPAPPASVADEGLSFALPVLFQVKHLSAPRAQIVADGKFNSFDVIGIFYSLF